MLVNKFILTNSPPGKLTDESRRTESSREHVSTFHLFCCNSVMRPTTTSPTSPLYLVFNGRTSISLLTLSTTPATDAFKSSPSTYVPCPLKNCKLMSKV